MPNEYTVISPLGKRNGPGTFDCVYDTNTYKTIEESFVADDYVKIDFVRDENGLIYFQFLHARYPEQKTYHKLYIQHFPFGIDIRDDNSAVTIAVEILKIHKKHG